EPPVPEGWPVPEERPVTLREAVELALENNPSAQQASLEIQKQETLQKTAFDPGPATLYYQQEETNGGNAGGVQSWGVQQDIDLPFATASKSRHLRERTELTRRAARL